MLLHGFSLTDISFPFIGNTGLLNDCEPKRPFVDSNIVLSKQVMKRNIIAVITFAVVLVSCQKEMDAPMNASSLSTVSTSNVQMISPTPVVTFDSDVLSHAISTFTDVVFSDSFYVSQNQAYLQAL